MIRTLALAALALCLPVAASAADPTPDAMHATPGHMMSHGAMKGAAMKGSSMKGHSTMKGHSMAKGGAMKGDAMHGAMKSPAPKAS